ncbi:DUF4282 domain-containing protein [Nocardioides coralli]|uniref:DUF4282 domain-containing protein n=1 Tax=Nocardioides coralli TaxID=2872154 RepID=UPI001CA3A8DA|nr:DUF4282 domain-containing protein [Nocardioides coralli]QZY29026.1 DUF4282 domain-containing protein [Nocardioides coralli]
MTQAMPPAQSGPAGQPPTSKGFFGALFDFTFEHFVTPMIVKVVYVLAVAGLALVLLVFLVTAFAQGPVEGLAVLVLGPVIGLLYLALIRMTLEFYLAVVRMSEDIHRRLPQR